MKRFLGLFFIRGFYLSIITASVMLGIIIYLFVCAKAPEMHRDWLRYKVGSKVVKIMNMQETGGGTGFHVETSSGKTYILTNNHVCAAADKEDQLNIHYFQDGEAKVIIRKVVKRHKTYDLCFVEPLDHMKNRGLTLGGMPYLGEWMYIYGHPGLRPLTLSQGELIGQTEITLSKTNISKEECDGEWTDMKDNPWAGMLGVSNVCQYKRSAYHITNIIYGGSSGSPVVNFWGSVVGVVFAGNPSVITDNYIVPYPIVREFIELN